MLLSWGDRANDIVTLHLFYTTAENSTETLTESTSTVETVGIGWNYFIFQLLTVISPSIIMTIYFIWKTRKETKTRQFMAVVGLGLFYPIVLPIAVLLDRIPKLAMGGNENENEERRIKRLRYAELIFSNLCSVSIW